MIWRKRQFFTSDIAEIPPAHTKDRPANLLQIRNSKWFDRLTILSEVEGQIQNPDFQNSRCFAYWICFVLTHQNHIPDFSVFITWARLVLQLFIPSLTFGFSIRSFLFSYFNAADTPAMSCLFCDFQEFASIPAATQVVFS
jgi:hypothetical protein